MLCKEQQQFSLQLDGLCELSNLGVNPPNVVQSPGHCIWEFAVDTKTLLEM